MRIHSQRTSRSQILLRISKLALGCVLISATACQWSQRWGSSTDLIVGRSGLYSSYSPPGPNPSGIVGINKKIPALTEDNIVEVRRIGGTVGVRPAGERGVHYLEYFRPRIQTGPGGVVITNPNGTARLAFADDSYVSLHDASLVRLGDGAAGEPWVACDRLTYLEVGTPLNSKFDSLELPGGARVKLVPQSKIKVGLERDRYYRIRNEGGTIVELTVGKFTTTLRPADVVDLPVIRNAPDEPEMSVGAFGNGIDAADAAISIRNPAIQNNNSKDGAPPTVRVGEAFFTTQQLNFDSLVRRGADRPPTAPNMNEKPQKEN
ncbi:MAG: hypothetical protein HY286_04240 [Planctomycetes bacterium]|nr:hypothetical protein [Planctomycetota bacterium]